MTMETLELLQLTGNEIQNLIRNYKKDPLSRKNNVFYFQERLNRLELKGLQKEFTATNAKLIIEEIPKNHDYFTKDYYNSIHELVIQCDDIFQGQIEALTQAPCNSKNVEEQENDQQKSVLSRAAENAQHVSAPIPQSIGIIRRFTAKMSTVERLLAGVADNIEHQTYQYGHVKRESLQNANNLNNCMIQFGIHMKILQLLV